MLERIIFSGAGGQGLMFIGKLFARMMIDKVPHLTLIPSYGAEVRGGTSNCQIVFSSQEIASPIVEAADALLLMNQPSVERFLPRLTAEGHAFINSSMAVDPDDARAALVPATELARQAGDILAANMVMLGAFLRAADFLDQEAIVTVIRQASRGRGADAEAVNTAAFQAGWQHGKTPTATDNPQRH